LLSIRRVRRGGTCMEQPRADWEIVRPNMMRMIRSAKSRLTYREGQGGVGASEDKGRGPLMAGGADRQGDVGREQDRPLKRSGAPRVVLGDGHTGRQRPNRSRSNADQAAALRGSENTAPAQPQAQTVCNPPTSASVAVLSDVTNTAGQQCHAPEGAKLSAALLQPPVAAAQPVVVPIAPGPQAPCAEAAPMPVTNESVPAQGPVGAAPEAPPSTCGANAATPTHSAASPSPIDLEADQHHAEDPQQVVEYVSDIYRHLQREEVECLPDPGYMDRQVQVNAPMRAILVDWLVDVHKKYKLRPETLFIAISLVDRFLERRATARRHLQLVGVTALLLASKFEEMYPPQVKDFVYVTDKAYSEDEVMNMEVSMLTVLDFRICRPTAIHFLYRFQLVNGCTEAHRDLVQYLLELTLVDYRMVKYKPSHLAAAAILLSNKLLRRQPCWTPAAVKHTRMTEQMLKECAKEMCKLVETAEANPLQAVRKKFSQLKHHQVAKMTFPILQASSATPSTTDEARVHSASSSCSYAKRRMLEEARVRAASSSTRRSSAPGASVPRPAPLPSSSAMGGASAAQGVRDDGPPLAPRGHGGGPHAAAPLAPRGQVGLASGGPYAAPPLAPRGQGGQASGGPYAMAPLAPRGQGGQASGGPHVAAPLAPRDQGGQAAGGLSASSDQQIGDVIASAEAAIVED